MRVIYNRAIPFGRKFRAINLFGVVFSKVPCDGTIINHERIHSAQMREMAYLPFYLAYGIEWLIRFLACRDGHRAYREISFEREAYQNQSDPGYLQRRRRYGFLKHCRGGR